MNWKSVAIILLIILISSGASAADLEITPENRQTVQTGESVEITGTVTGDASEIEQLRLIEEGGTDNNRVYCNSTPCEITDTRRSYSETVTEYTFEAELDSEETLSESVTIEWTDQEEQDSIEEITLEPSDDQAIETGENIDIQATAEGEGIDWIKLGAYENNQWENSPERSYCNSSCNVDITERSYQEQDIEFRAKAQTDDGQTQLSDPITVTWEDTTEPEIETLSIEPSGNVDRNTGETVTVEGEASGTELDWIRIQSKESGSWDEEAREQCTTTCSISENFRSYTEREEEYRIQIKDQSNDREESDVLNVEWIEEERDGDLEVTVRDDEGDRLEDAYVRVRNGDYESEHTDSRGEADFYNLHTGEYDLYVRCEGERESEDIDVDEGNNYETVRLDFDSFDNECDDDDEENDGELTVNVQDENSDSLDARVRVDGQVEYTGNDGRSVFDSLPREEIEVRVSKNDYDNEYRDVDLSDDRVQSIDVTLSESETREDEDACRITQSSLEFTLEDYTIERGESTEANLRIDNPGTEDQDVEVKIKVSTDVVESRTVTVPAEDSRTVSERISPERDQFVTAEASTTGSPCGFQSFNDITREITVLADSGDDASLDVEVYDRDNDPVENARVRVDGPEDLTRYTDSYGETGFRLQSGDYDVTVSHPRYETEYESVELFSGDEEDLEFRLRRSDSYDDEDGSLDITVLDGNGDWIRDARVRVENGETQTKRTDRYGFTNFRLEEDRYDIEVRHPDYDRTAYGSVYVEPGETSSKTFRLDRDNEDGIQITSVDYPSSVCRGDTLSVDYRVRNNENFDESATTTARGLGSNIITNRYVIESGDTVSGTLRFTNVEGSGSERFNIRVQNGTTDRASRTVRVNNCQASEAVRDADASQVSMKLSYPISPNKALVGDTVKVSGFVDGVNGRTNVDIDVDGDQKASVSTQPDGYYQTYIRADSVGTKTVRATAGGTSSSRQIEVLPTATVGFVNAPKQVFEGENYRVCSEVTSQIEAKILLLRDGEVVQSTNANGEVCFDLEASQPGTHIYEVTAVTPGEASTSRTSIRVLETDVEATSFPDQVASVESGSGMIKVDLYNTHNELKRYDLDLQGVPGTWSAQTSKQVILDSGERKTAYFYVTPRDEGSYNPEIVINADGDEVYRQEVNLEVGGSDSPPRKSLVQKISNLLSF